MKHQQADSRGAVQRQGCMHRLIERVQALKAGRCLQTMGLPIGAASRVLIKHALSTTAPVVCTASDCDRALGRSSIAWHGCQQGVDQNRPEEAGPALQAGPEAEGMAGPEAAQEAAQDREGSRWVAARAASADPVARPSSAVLPAEPSGWTAAAHRGTPITNEARQRVICNSEGLQLLLTPSTMATVLAPTCL